MKSPVVLCCLVGQLVTVACQQEASEAFPQFGVSDSAGIPLVTLTLPPASMAREVSTAVWVFGAEAGSSQISTILSQVADVAAGGEWVYAIDGSTQQIVRWRPGHTPPERLGRRGDGPGEFRRLSNLVGFADGVVGGIDRQRNKYVEFDSLGQPNYVTGLHAGALESTFLDLVQIGERIDRHGIWIATLPRPERNLGRTVWRGVGALVRFLGAADTIATFLGPQMTEGRLGTAVLLAYGAAPVFAGSPGGLWLGDNAIPELRLLGQDGHVRMIVRWSGVRRPLSASRKQELLQHTIEEAGNGSSLTLEVLEELFPMADSLPTYFRMLADTGMLAIGLHPGPEYLLSGDLPGIDWAVIDFDNEAVERVRTPAGFWPHEWTRGLMIGVHRDSMGVQTVRGYAVAPEM